MALPLRIPSKVCAEAARSSCTIGWARHRPSSRSTASASTTLVIAEGMVTRIDRKRRLISVRFAGGLVEQLELTEQAAAEIAPGDPAGVNRVRVYYRDESGRRVVHYFTKLEREVEKP
jgi:hypothetical protein